MAQTSKLLPNKSDSDLKAESMMKDGTQAWIVCLALVTARALTNGVLHSWGSFLVDFVDKFDVSKQKVGK